MRPGNSGLRVSPDTTLEDRVAALRESGVLEDLLEDWRRWVAGSAGKCWYRGRRLHHNLPLNSLLTGDLLPGGELSFGSLLYVLLLLLLLAGHRLLLLLLQLLLLLLLRLLLRLRHLSLHLGSVEKSKSSVARLILRRRRASGEPYVPASFLPSRFSFSEDRLGAVKLLAAVHSLGGTHQHQKTIEAYERRSVSWIMCRVTREYSKPGSTEQNKTKEFEQLIIRFYFLFSPLFVDFLLFY